MSLERFRRAVLCLDIGEQDKKWLPKWMAGYCQFHRRCFAQQAISTSRTQTQPSTTTDSSRKGFGAGNAYAFKAQDKVKRQPAAYAITAHIN